MHNVRTKKGEEQLSEVTDLVQLAAQQETRGECGFGLVD